MGKYWLHDLPREAAARGLTIDTYPGWELRSRSSGGLDGIWGVCMHHTAGITAPENDMAWQWLNSPIRPIGNISLHRDGKIVLGAAGAANTQGRGGPYTTSKGTVPLDQGNKYFIAIEACNSGVGEVWPDAQVRAYERLTAVLCDIYGLDPLVDVILHATWAPTRKIDPAGPTPLIPTWGGTSGARTWDLAQVRHSVLHSGGGIPDMSDFEITNPVRIVDTRTGTPHNTIKVRMTPGNVISAKPHGYTPHTASGVILNVTGLAWGVGGYLTFWSGEGAVPAASHVNPQPGYPANNMVWVPIVNGSFKIAAGGGLGASLGVVIDQVGWYTL